MPTVQPNLKSKRVCVRILWTFASLRVLSVEVRYCCRRMYRWWNCVCNKGTNETGNKKKRAKSEKIN